MEGLAHLRVLCGAGVMNEVEVGGSRHRELLVNTEHLGIRGEALLAQVCAGLAWQALLVEGGADAEAGAASRLELYY
jgi:hypothetical protein